MHLGRIASRSVLGFLWVSYSSDGGGCGCGNGGGRGGRGRRRRRPCCCSLSHTNGALDELGERFVVAIVSRIVKASAVGRRGGSCSGLEGQSVRGGGGSSSVVVTCAAANSGLRVRMLVCSMLGCHVRVCKDRGESTTERQRGGREQKGTHRGCWRAREHSSAPVYRPDPSLALHPRVQQVEWSKRRREGVLQTGKRGQSTVIATRTVQVVVSIGQSIRYRWTTPWLPPRRACSAPPRCWPATAAPPAPA